MHKQIIRYVVNEPEVITPAKLLYEFTFPELLETMKPVVDEKGHLWAGKDRKQNLQDESGKIALWRAWQQSFKTHAPIPQKAMDYFQNTKHLSRPPREGDIGLSDKKALFVPIQEVERPRLISPSGRKFTYSHSSLSCFDTCPMQYAGRYFYGAVPYEETEATRWGSRVHSIIENILKGNSVSDPDVEKLVMPYCNAISKSPGDKLVEHKMALTEQWSVCDFDADEKEGSAISDVIILHEDKATCLDWKSGARRDKKGNIKTISNDQLIINFIFISLHFPHVQQFAGKYVYLHEPDPKYRTPGTDTLSRKELMPHIAQLKEKIQRVKQAWEYESWRVKTSGLCKAHCGYLECPHNGRR